MVQALHGSPCLCECQRAVLQALHELEASHHVSCSGCGAANHGAEQGEELAAFRLQRHLDDEGHGLLHLEAHFLVLCQTMQVSPHLPHSPLSS